MMVVLMFFLGLTIGSFLNILIDRLPKGESVIKGRSRCDKCKKILKWHDLIPLLSFIMLKGKCRYCHTRLSPYYPIVELTAGIIFVLTAFFILNGSQFLPLRQGFEGQAISNFQLLMSLIYYLFILSSLIVVFFADLRYGIIPDKVLFPAIFVSFFFLLFTSKESWLNFVQPATFEVGFVNHLLSAVGASLFFLLLFLATRGRGMGFGDVKFVFLMGLILGFPNIVVALYSAFLTGAIVGCILIIWRKKRIFGITIPFGPFLAIGSLIAIFFGDTLMQSFLRVLP